MKVSRYHGFKVGLLIGPSLAGIALGSIFGFLISPAPTVRTIIQGAVCGMLIGLSAFYLEYFVVDRLRKLTLIVSVILRTIIFSIIIVISYVISDLVVFGAGTLVHDVRTFILPSFGIAMFFILVLMLFINISRLLGQKSLVRLLIGLYHKPVIEKRIFMFIDLASSTTIAEEIGDLRFHSFLNDFFFDATRPIVESKGEIYKYVGDEIIVSWTMKNGLRECNCLECFFQIEDKIRELGGRYEKTYGTMPRFSAGLHCGDAVIGEMGDYKREVAFLGDVVNTASRIQNECRTRSRGLIISADLFDEFTVEGRDPYEFESLGSIALRGKKRTVPLYSVTRRGPE